MGRHTATLSSSSASRRSVRYWGRARSSVRSGDTRSVRAAEQTIREPPGEHPQRLSVVEQLVGDVLVGVAPGWPWFAAGARRG